jgi:hypothetical protein
MEPVGMVLVLVMTQPADQETRPTAMIPFNLRCNAFVE